MMRTDAGLHADQARGHIGKACFDLTPRPLLPQPDCATTIEPNDVERVLTDINADYGNRTLCCRSHGVLLVLVPLASLSLAEQEHGRTIPLTDSGPRGPVHRNTSIQNNSRLRQGRELGSGPWCPN